MNYLINHTWQEPLFNIALIKLLKISDTYRDVKKWFKGRKAWSMNEIRNAYGSKVFENGAHTKELETA